MAFSAALALTDLNDFLGPSQECIKPVNVANEPVKQEKDVGAAATEIQIDHGSGAYYEIDAAGSTSANEGQKLKKAEITLNDCLACSGCVTSAESVLVAMQSHEEVYKVLREQPELTPLLSISPQSIASLAALHHISPPTCLRRLRRAFRESLGFTFIFDTTFARHLSLLEGQQEFYEKAPSYKGKERAEPGPEASKSFPLLASACPGWICYAEKTHGELLPFISSVKSPQQIMGSMVKEWIGPKLGLQREQIYHVSVMPCYDKKLEASRSDFATETGNRDVDCVLTTGEVERILQEKGIVLEEMEDIAKSPDDEEERYIPSLLSHTGSASGGYLHNTILAAIKAYPRDGLGNLALEVKTIRGEDYVEYLLRSGTTTVFRGAKCYGFRNLQNVVRKVGREAGVTVTKGAAGKAVSKSRGMVRRSARPSASATPDEPERGFDYIEVMACPSGCVNGGGQISPPKHPSPVKVDREGMPVLDDDVGEYKMVADEKDGHRVLSGKEWVARVEEMYWQLGGRKIVNMGEADLSIHESLRFYVEPLVHQVEYDKLAGQLINEITAGAADPAETVQRFLRTQYRAIESDEVNGLAVKW